MKSTIFTLLPLVGFAFAESSCDAAQRKTVTSTQYEYETVTAKAVADKAQATPDAATSSTCSRRTVTTTEVERVTVTVDAGGKPPKTIDVTSTSTKYIQTTVIVRPSGVMSGVPAGSAKASSLQWSNYPNATYHASSIAMTSTAVAKPTSQLPDFSIIGQEAAVAAPTSSIVVSAMPTSEAAASSAAPAAPAASDAPQAAPEAASDTTTSAAGSKRGEATFYGGNTDGGMCSFTGYTIPSGIYGTALSDSNWDSANACGQCVSVTGPDGKTKVTAMVVDQVSY
jgi:hypothetical protein